jgi:putative FmdB family regulatory protein
MPIYEYVCEKCAKLNDVLQKVNDPPPACCDGCGAKDSLTKIVSRSSFVLRGGGWYSDLYSSAKKEAGKSEKDGKGKESATEAKESATAASEPKATSSVAPPGPAPKSSGTAEKK